jgi:integrase
LASYEDKLFAQWRDKTLVLLLMDTGLRINEALSLAADQVDFKELTIIVPSQIAKNRKYRDVPISREVAKRLRQLLDAQISQTNVDCIDREALRCPFPLNISLIRQPFSSKVIDIFPYSCSAYIVDKVHFRA